MTGAVMAAFINAGVSAGGGGGVVVPFPAPAWSNIFGIDSAYTNNQTVQGTTVPITIALANSGGGAMYYILNGSTVYYTGAFNVDVGDILAFGIAVGNTAKSGTITVTNVSNASATLATISYVVKSSGGGGGRGILP